MKQREPSSATRTKEIHIRSEQLQNKILLYTEKQLEEMFGLSRATIWRERGKGNLRPVRIGRAVRYTESEVERFVTELEANAGLEA